MWLKRDYRRVSRKTRKTEGGRIARDRWCVCVRRENESLPLVRLTHRIDKKKKKIKKTRNDEIENIIIIARCLFRRIRVAID